LPRHVILQQPIPRFNASVRKRTHTHTHTYKYTHTHALTHHGVRAHCEQQGSRGRGRGAARCRCAVQIAAGAVSRGHRTTRDSQDDGGDAGEAAAGQRDTGSDIAGRYGAGRDARRASQRVCSAHIIFLPRVLPFHHLLHTVLVQTAAKLKHTTTTRDATGTASA
jgi:hypothetical protein